MLTGENSDMGVYEEENNTLPFREYLSCALYLTQGVATLCPGLSAGCPFRALFAALSPTSVRKHVGLHAPCGNLVEPSATGRRCHSRQMPELCCLPAISLQPVRLGRIEACWSTLTGYGCREERECGASVPDGRESPCVSVAAGQHQLVLPWRLVCWHELVSTCCVRSKGE